MNQNVSTKHESVKIASDTAGVTLAGTWSEPDAASAAVLLLPGSGPQDRHETIQSQQPFRELADQLNAVGIATLRCDDRGVGESTGDYLSADEVQILADAEKQLQWIMNEHGSLPVSIVGHSQGALFALRLAERVNSIQRLILLGATFRPGMTFMMEMREQLAQDAGLTGDEFKNYMEHSRQLFWALTEIEDPTERERKLRDLIRSTVSTARDEDFFPDFSSVDEYVDFAVKDSLEWEVLTLLKSRPAEHLAKVSNELEIPVLALWGQLDRHLNAEMESSTYEEVRGPTSKGEILPGLNHLFQVSQMGYLEDYEKDGPTMRPPVVDRIAEWLSAS